MLIKGLLSVVKDAASLRKEKKRTAECGVEERGEGFSLASYFTLPSFLPPPQRWKHVVAVSKSSTFIKLSLLIYLFRHNFVPPSFKGTSVE